MAVSMLVPATTPLTAVAAVTTRRVSGVRIKGILRLMRKKRQ
jgi:hypothetical protein